MSIRLKLLLSFLGLSLIGALIGVVGIVSLNSMKAADDDSYKYGTRGLLVVMQIFQGMDQVKVGMRDEALSNDDLGNRIANEAYQKGLETFNKGVAAYEASIIGPDQRSLFNLLKEAANEYFPLATQDMTLGLQDKNEEAAALIRTPAFVKARADMNVAIQKLTDYEATYVARLHDANTALGEFSDVLMAIIIALGVAVSIILGLLVTNSINRPVRRVNEELRIASTSLESASSQVSASSQQLSSSSSELASSIEEMTSSLEELQSIIEANTKSVNQGELLMQETVTEVNRVSDKMQDLKVALGDISKNSKRISKIIKVIDDIAFQTNILALNAAVEAARAGDAGKGFAVVADQVKALAQKSADAAKETADLIEQALAASDNGETLGNASIDIQLVAAEKAGKVAVILDEVNRASKEQLKGANQITQAVTQVNSVVQNTASSSEENAAAGEELQAQAESLAGNVTSLDRIINGRPKGAAAGAERAPNRSAPPPPSRSKAGLALPRNPGPKAVSGIEVTKPEDIIPLKDFKDF